MNAQRLLAGFAWLSVFSIGFLLIFGKISNSALTFGILFLFFTIALFASVADPDRKKKPVIDVCIGARIYTDDDPEFFQKTLPSGREMIWIRTEPAKQEDPRK